MAKKITALVERVWSNWHYSILLTIIYTCIFHFWTFCSSHKTIILAGTVTVIGLSIWLWKNKDYFTTPVDLIIHALVILDIFLEAILIFPHSGLGFYWCTIAFIAVIWPYRYAMLLKRNSNAP